jgi:hypothetical protein
MDLTVEEENFDFDGHVLSWNPGSEPVVEPGGMAWRADPGMSLVLNVHLRATGKPEIINPEISARWRRLEFSTFVRRFDAAMQSRSLLFSSASMSQWVRSVHGGCGKRLLRCRRSLENWVRSVKAAMISLPPRLLPSGATNARELLQELPRAFKANSAFKTVIAEKRRVFPPPWTLPDHREISGTAQGGLLRRVTTG